MLQSMRTGAGNVFAKIMLTLLAASFVLWGIGDVYHTFAGDTTVAKIGSIKISAQELTRETARRTEMMQQSMGKRFDPAMLRLLRFDMQVLNSMIDDILIRKESRAQGIIVGDDVVLEDIRHNEAFQSEGKFDIKRFRMLLQSNRMGEAQFYDQMRIRSAAKLLLSAFDGPPPYPSALLPLLATYQSEQRSAELMLISKASLRAITPPSEAEMNSYYEAAKSSYIVPESRSVSYTLIDFADATKGITVSPDELKAAYDQRKTSLSQPESREVDQLLYDTEEKAKHAHSLLTAKDTTFEIVSKSVPAVNASKLSIGTITKSQIMKEAADTVFALQPGQISPIVKTDFGWHIFRVVKILPGHTQSLAEVRPALEKDLRQRAAEEAITRTVNQLEDALAGGTTLETAAKQAGLSVHTAGPLHKDAAAPEDKKPASFTAGKAFLDTAFATDEKTESQAVPAEDGSYFILRTDSVTPERTKTLAEIKPLLMQSWMAEKQRAELQALAEKATADLKKGTSFTTVAQSLGASVRTTGFIKRDATQAAGLAVDADFLNDLFSRKQGEATEPHAVKEGFLLGRTTAMRREPSQAKADISSLTEKLTKNYHDELYSQYTTYLRDKYDVAIYPNHMSKAEDPQTEQ